MLKTAIAFAESTDELRIQFGATGETWLASADLPVFDNTLTAARGQGVRLELSDSRLRRILLRAEREGHAMRLPRTDPSPPGGVAASA